MWSWTILSAEGSRAASLLKAHGFRLDEIRHEIDVLRSRLPLARRTQRCARRRSDGSRCPTEPWRSSAARSSKRSIDRSWMKRVEERHDLELADGSRDLAGRLRNELGLELTPDRRSVPWIVVRENG